MKLGKLGLRIVSAAHGTLECGLYVSLSML